jgi:transcriptional regulator with XRE-family HTH domain
MHAKTVMMCRMSDTATAADGKGLPAWTLGWRLRRALTHADVGAEEMAVELGVTRTTVSRWMNDHGAPPRAAFVKQWALRTGVPVDWLIHGDDSQRAVNGLSMALGVEPDSLIRCILNAGPQDALAAMVGGRLAEQLRDGEFPAIGWYSHDRPLRIVENPQVSNPERTKLGVASLAASPRTDGDRMHSVAA